MEIKRMINVEKDVLIPELAKASQVGRSLCFDLENKKKFNKILMESIQRLRKLVDRKKITNNKIRREILNISGKTGASIGQAQKTVNVYLKVYCMIREESDDIMRELDCPLDSTIMKGKPTMRGLKNVEEYIEWQKKFEGGGKARILGDLKYDFKRLKEFKNPKK